jgi:soluble lytic murein transglycosylase-like protein
MDSTEKLLLIGAGAIGLLWAVKAFGRAATAPPIEPTRLERQVMGHSDLIWTVADAYDVEPALIAAVMAVESSGVNAAPRQVKVRKYTGEEAYDWVVGLMQVRLDTARENCNVWHHYDLQSPAVNVECGVKYLRSLLDRFGTVTPAVSAYNVGPGGVIWDSSMVGGIEYLNVGYIRNVLGMIPRFRVLFMAEKGASLYNGMYPPERWSFEIP